MLNTQSDYRKELEKAAKRMILIHNVDTLVKLILRSTVRFLRIEHASLLLYDQTRNAYVAHTSKGKPGLIIPKGFTRISNENPVINYFTQMHSQIIKADYLLFSHIGNMGGQLQEKIKDQFVLYNAMACIPGFFREKLIFALFLGRKMDRQDFTDEELGFLSVLSSDVVMAIQNASLFQGLNEQLLRNKDLFLQTVFALSSAIEAKDPYTQGHTKRVTRYALVVAEELKATGKIYGTDPVKFFEDLRIAALLHDIGKIGIAESILNKNGVLDEDERKEMQKHPYIGAKILSEVNEFYESILGVKYHHEKYDGSGYPDALKGESIPLIARIISIADTFDAITSNRSYRETLSREEAIRLIIQQSGKQFDPAVVEAFLNACKKGQM
ncbi:MAG: HD domain-containing protein [Candidatus Omnitrophica bacterium]|nr:HD domain-containing protein [Candidatus Omnitrophota bacterium]